MNELVTLRNELERVLAEVECGRSIGVEYMRSRYERLSVLSEDASSLSRQASALAKLAVYIIHKGSLWRCKFTAQEDWIGAISVDEKTGFSRSSIFEFIKDIEMARSAGLSIPEVAQVLASAPTAMRDVRRMLTDADGKFKDMDVSVGAESIPLADGGAKATLLNLLGLGSGEARTHVLHDVAGVPRRFIKDIVMHNGRILAKIVVEHNNVLREYDVVIDGISEKDDALWFCRRLGKEPQEL